MSSLVEDRVDTSNLVNCWMVLVVCGVLGMLVMAVMKHDVLQRPGIGGSTSSGSAVAARGRKKDREVEPVAERDKPFSCEGKSSFAYNKMNRS